MPYIYVDEVPEGAEVADVVTREEHDTLNERYTETQERVDRLVESLEQAREDVRQAKAKYADYILGVSQRDTDKKKEPEVVPTPTLPVSAKELFSGKGKKNA